MGWKKRKRTGETDSGASGIEEPAALIGRRPSVKVLLGRHASKFLEARSAEGTCAKFVIGLRAKPG